MTAVPPYSTHATVGACSAQRPQFNPQEEDSTGLSGEAGASQSKMSESSPSQSKTAHVPAGAVTCSMFSEEFLEAVCSLQLTVKV